MVSGRAYFKALISKQMSIDLYATCGCHPTRSSEFEKDKVGPEAYLAKLDDLIQKNRTARGRVVAIGECGLGRL